MNIGIASIAYGGYEKYIESFLKDIAKMKQQPRQVVIAVPKGTKTSQYKDPIVEFVKVAPPFNMGKMRNKAIEKLGTEWVWYVSVDDRPEPNAINIFEWYEKSDYICAKWFSIGLGLHKRLHKSPTPQEYYKNITKGKKGGFIIAHSPFKKWLWDKQKYVETDYPNYDFLLKCVQSGAIFSKARLPTTTYKRRRDSHARTVLIKPQEKRKAVREKIKLENGLRKYYASK